MLRACRSRRSRTRTVTSSDHSRRARRDIAAGQWGVLHFDELVDCGFSRRRSGARRAWRAAPPLPGCLCLGSPQHPHRGTLARGREGLRPVRRALALFGRGAPRARQVGRAALRDHGPDEAHPSAHQGPPQQRHRADGPQGHPGHAEAADRDRSRGASRATTSSSGRCGRRSSRPPSSSGCRRAFSPSVPCPRAARSRTARTTSSSSSASRCRSPTRRTGCPGGRSTPTSTGRTCGWPSRSTASSGTTTRSRAMTTRSARPSSRPPGSGSCASRARTCATRGAIYARLTAAGVKRGLGRGFGVRRARGATVVARRRQLGPRARRVDQRVPQRRDALDHGDDDLGEGGDRVARARPGSASGPPAADPDPRHASTSRRGHGCRPRAPPRWRGRHPCLCGRREGAGSASLPPERSSRTSPGSQLLTSNAVQHSSRRGFDGASSGMIRPPPVIPADPRATL